MLRRPMLGATLAALAALLGLLAARPALPAAPAPVRIMPLGDSITGSPGCWRALLWNRLQNSGHTNIDFVGTLGPQGCGQPYDGDNEGHGGYLATNVANDNLLPGWLSATRPDIVLMHFGTNDVWNNRSPSTILAAYGKLVDQMRASNPKMKIMIAQLIPMAPSNCAECGQRVVALNNAIPAWAADKSTRESPIVVVDQWSGFSTATDTYDGVHPNAAGDQKMADKWYPALVAALEHAAATTPPTIPPSSPPAGGGCAASYRVIGQWQGGFQAEVTVRNSGTEPISGWTVRFSLGGGERISQAWNASVNQSGAEVTARNVSWNGNLGAGSAATFGFLGSSGASAPQPSLSCAVG